MSENQKEPQYKLRWPEELRDKVVESAKQHNRSINAEICTRLEQSFVGEEKPPTQYVDISKALGMIFEEIQDLKKNQEK